MQNECNVLVWQGLAISGFTDDYACLGGGGWEGMNVNDICAAN